MSNEWRHIVAALDHEERRRVYAEVVLGLPGTPSARREKTLAALRDAGLVDAAGAVIPNAFARLLADTPPVTRTGLDRWVRDDVLVDWPSRPADREQVLAWLLERVIGTDEELGERALTDRLAAIVPDAVGMRRALVDAGMVTRAADGSRYRRG